MNEPMHGFSTLMSKNLFKDHSFLLPVLIGMIISIFIIFYLFPHPEMRKNLSREKFEKTGDVNAKDEKTGPNQLSFLIWQ